MPVHQPCIPSARITCMTDRYFDQIGAHFARKIYASPKGAIRLAVLTRDLEQWMQGRLPAKGSSR